MNKLSLKNLLPLMTIWMFMDFSGPRNTPLPTDELRHLRRALQRLEEVNDSNSPTIANLIVGLRIAELEASIRSNPYDKS